MEFEKLSTEQVNEESKNLDVLSPLEAARLMADRQLRRLAVTENGRLVGMLSLGDLATVPDCEMEASQALSEISLNVRRR